MPPDISRTDAVFESAVRLCEECAQQQDSNMGSMPPISPEVPRLLREVFDDDFARLLHAQKSVHNLTCMQPAVAADERPLFGEELLAVPLQPGRACRDGECCDACSRIFLPDFASHDECDAFISSINRVMVPAANHPHHNLYLASSAASGDVRLTLTFLRMLERMRRFIAHEYGLDLARLRPRQTFISRITYDAADESRQSLHADESSYGSFHYSCVLYLSTQGADFEGGSFTFNDPADGAGGGRVLSPLAPSAGTAVVFSSGWENLHAVGKVTAGCRFAVPAFFTTAVDDGKLERFSNMPDMVQASAAESDAYRPGCAETHDAAAAKALWRCALMPESEDDFRQLFARWHHLLAATPPPP